MSMTVVAACPVPAPGPVTSLQLWPRRHFESTLEPSDMDFLAAILGTAFVIGGLAAFGLAALRWGIDSRDGSVADPFLADSVHSLFAATRS